MYAKLKALYILFLAQVVFVATTSAQQHYIIYIDSGNSTTDGLCMATIRGDMRNMYVAGGIQNVGSSFTVVEEQSVGAAIMDISTPPIWVNGTCTGTYDVLAHGGTWASGVLDGTISDATQTDNYTWQALTGIFSGNVDGCGSPAAGNQVTNTNAAMARIAAKYKCNVLGLAIPVSGTSGSGTGNQSGGSSGTGLLVPVGSSSGSNYAGVAYVPGQAPFLIDSSGKTGAQDGYQTTFIDANGVYYLVWSTNPNPSLPSPTAVQQGDSQPYIPMAPIVPDFLD